MKETSKQRGRGARYTRVRQEQKKQYVGVGGEVRRGDRSSKSRSRRGAVKKGSESEEKVTLLQESQEKERQVSVRGYRERGVLWPTLGEGQVRKVRNKTPVKHYAMTHTPGRNEPRRRKRPVGRKVVRSARQRPRKRRKMQSLEGRARLQDHRSAWDRVDRLRRIRVRKEVRAESGSSSISTNTNTRGGLANFASVAQQEGRKGSRERKRHRRKRERARNLYEYSTRRRAEEEVQEEISRRRREAKEGIETTPWDLQVKRRPPLWFWKVRKGRIGGPSSVSARQEFLEEQKRKGEMGAKERRASFSSSETGRETTLQGSEAGGFGLGLVGLAEEKDSVMGEEPLEGVADRVNLVNEVDEITQRRKSQNEGPRVGKQGGGRKREAAKVGEEAIYYTYAVDRSTAWKSYREEVKRVESRWLVSRWIREVGEMKHRRGRGRHSREGGLWEQNVRQTDGLVYSQRGGEAEEEYVNALSQKERSVLVEEAYAEEYEEEEEEEEEEVIVGKVTTLQVSQEVARVSEWRETRKSSWGTRERGRGIRKVQWRRGGHKERVKRRCK